MLHAKWSKLLILARWVSQLRSHGFGNQFQWPPDSWYASLHHVEASKPVESHVVPEEASELARRLREWAPLILSRFAEDEEEERESERMRLRDSISSLQNWAFMRASMRGDYPKPVRHDCISLLNAVRLARTLRGGANHLADVVARCLDLLGFDSSQCRGTLSKLPGASTVKRHELTLDVALMLWEGRRERAATEPILRWGWTDSSPQERHDWVWEQTVEVSKVDLLHCFMAALEIARSAASASEEELDSAIIQMPESWLQPLQVLKTALRIHIVPPVAVGKGTRGLVHKASAKVHAHYMELQDRSYLVRRFRSFRSHTSDLGTEIGLPDLYIRDGDVGCLLPSWFEGVDPGGGDLEVDVDHEAAVASPELAPDVDHDEVPDEDMEPIAPAEPAAALPPSLTLSDNERFMAFSFTIPGLHHIIDNLSKHMSSQLKSFPAFKASLKNLEAFLTRKELVDIYVVSCLQQHPEWAKAKQKDIQRWSHTLYEERWREVVSFVEALLPLLPCLRATWSEGRFSVACAKDGRVAAVKENCTFNEHTLTETLYSSFFDRFAAMIFAVESLGKKLGSWAESCPCHGTLFEHVARRLSTQNPMLLQKNLLRQHYGNGVVSCPLAGMLAPVPALVSTWCDLRV